MNKVLSIFSTHRLILAIFGIALIVRFLFAALPPFKSDMDSFIAWSIHVFQDGFSQFYSGKIWTDYAPGYIYFLWVLAFLKTYFFSHSFYSAVLFLYKFFPMLCDILTGFFIYKIILSLSPSLTRRHVLLGSLLALLYVLNPIIIMNSSVWGQVDSVFVLFLAVSFYFLARNRVQFAVISYVFACFIKPQAGLVAPAYFLFLVSAFDMRRIFFAFLIGIFSFFLFAFPFFGFDSVMSFASLLSSSVNTYQYGSVNMFNLWGIFGFWKPDFKPFLLGLTQQQLGFALFVVFTVLGSIYTFFHIRLASSATRLLFFTAFCAYMILMGTMVLTRIHERYLFPFFLYFILFIGLYFLHAERTGLFSNTLARLSFFMHGFFYFVLSFIHFLNLYYVYVFYYYRLYFETDVPPDYVFFYSIAQSLSMWSFVQLFFAILFIVSLFYTIRFVRRGTYDAVT